MIQDDDKKVTERLKIPIDDEILTSYGFSNFLSKLSTDYSHDTIPHCTITKTIDKYYRSGIYTVTSVYIATIEIFDHEANYVKKTFKLHTVSDLIEYMDICKQMNALRDRVERDGAIIEAKIMHLGASWYVDNTISQYSAPKLI